MEYKLPPEIKASWTAALRSGKYPQVRGRLRTSEGFCCLGVYCDLAEPESWTSIHTFGPHERVSWWHNFFSGTPVYENLAVHKALYQLYTISGVQIPVEDILIEMNDGGNSFTEIADWIEENL